MSSEFADSFTQPGDDGDFAGYDAHRFDSFSATHFAESDPVDDVFAAQSPPSIFVESNTQDFDEGFAGESEGPILPPPSEMDREEGSALREWRRENAIRLAEKEMREKELLNQIIDEADEYKLEFYQKRKIACDNTKTANREKEKVFLANQEKFHAEANKMYWKAIAELIPNEVPTIEKKGKKDKDKKPSIVIIQGPKPGKPTDLSRMRQILVKLKHSTPDHLKHAPPPPVAASENDAKTNAALAPAAAAPTKSKAVAVA